MKIFNKTLLLLMIHVTVLVADNAKPVSQLDFSSLINDFMEEGITLKKTINLSGKQRMLTQRMSKLVLQVDLDIQKKESTSELKKIAESYAKALNAFKNGDSDLGIIKATNTKVLTQITLVEKEWKPFYEHVKNIVNGKDDGKSLEYIKLRNEKLLAVSNDLVKAYEASNTSSNYLEKARLRVVNVAGRQRMLTQKMTKEKLLLLKGEKAYTQKLAETIKLFDSSLTAIMKGDKTKSISKPTNEKIIKQLKMVAAMWTELKPLYIKEKNSVKELATIISKNSVLLEEMNTMVQMAEKEVEY
jgi:hypothetical protein